MQILLSGANPVLGVNLFPANRPADFFSTDYSESNQTIEFRLVEDANLTAISSRSITMYLSLSTIDYFEDVIRIFQGFVRW